MNALLLADAMDGFGRRLEAVGDVQWASPTPCADWDVRTLANHVAGELLWVPPLLDGRTIAEVGDRFDGDVLGADPFVTWVAAGAAVRAAAAQPGAQEATVHLSFGDFPGGEYLSQVASDVVIHTWDLARAIGADDRLGDELVTFVDEFLTPQIEAWRTAGAFGPPATASADADLQDRVIANTGRSPSWMP